MNKVISKAFIGLSFLMIFLGAVWSALPEYLVIAGDAGAIIGFYIVFKTFQENTFTAANIQVDDAQTVITTGPYSIIRHPMYSGALLLLLSTPIALNSCWALLVFIPLCAIIVVRLLDEERFLKKNLAGYASYCLKVKWRLFPGLF